MRPESISREAADRSRGRTAPPDLLRRLLRSASAPFLAGALDNPALDSASLVLLLRNRQATPELLGRLAENRNWVRRAEVRRLLVQHPRAPLALAQRLMHTLFWNDLADVTVNPSSHPFVRRESERLLVARLDELAAGERVSLARRAPRGVIAALLHGDEPPVIVALLGNPRLVEIDAVKLARSPRVPPHVLALLATHPRWGERRAVRLALVANPRTPVASALALVHRLVARDLRALLRDVKVPRIVRVGAERRLAVGRTARPAEGRARPGSRRAVNQG